VEVPLSVESKRILNLAAKESERLGQKQVGTEHLHLLLGILRENDCWAARLLTERGLQPDWIREELAHPSTDPQTKTAEDTVSVRQVVDALEKPEGWSIARVQATGLEPQSRSAAV
jgi:ATP-dependent Clp protease ATP-binding subunit ClpC